MTNGFVFSLEAGMAVLLLATVVVSLPHSEPPETSVLLIVQKQHDLLMVWDATNTPEEEMAADFALVFPGQGGRIRSGKTEILVPGNGKKKVVTTAVLFMSGKRVPVTLVVYT